MSDDPSEPQTSLPPDAEPLAGPFSTLRDALLAACAAFARGEEEAAVAFVAAATAAVQELDPTTCVLEPEALRELSSLQASVLAEAKRAREDARSGLERAERSSKAASSYARTAGTVP